MKHYIPDNLIEEIRSRSDILEVVSANLLLKKSGQNYKGLCPFHSEKTPSFTVSPEKQIYHCFGCGAGGNVFKFIMEMEDLPFLDVVKKLASKCGVELPNPKSGQSNARQSEREMLLSINEKARAYFTRLLKDDEGGRSAREYLKSRSFYDEKLLAEYGIGWAAPGWKDILTYLQNQGKCSRKDLLRAGLIKQKEGAEEGNCYDRFRGRIMFPFKDIHGNLIAFAGRVIGEGEPKYLNSPETPLYIKGKHLFGLDRAREAIRKQNRVLIMEGYFDQMRAHQHGIRNTVATCGTALTPAQATLLKNHTSRTTLIFDSDSAGQAATERGFGVLLEEGLGVEVLSLPKGHDPDSYIQQFGPEKFLEELKNARPFVESYIINTIESGDISTPAGKMEVVNSVLPLLTRIKNTVERSEWVRVLTERAGLDDQAILAELKNAIKQDRNIARQPAKTSERAGKQNPELYIVHLMLADKRLALQIKEEVPVDKFEDPSLRQIVELFYQLIDEGCELRVDLAIDRVEEPTTKTLLSKIGLEPIPFDDKERSTNDCILAINKRSLDQKIEALIKQRDEAFEARDSERSKQLQDQLRELRMELIPGQVPA
ncbi:MAG: DNA primase [Nitrospinaceae bacterium]|nr:DNA primase [Nitrospinaceae bacterium]